MPEYNSELLKRNWDAIHQRIARACEKSGRKPADVRLIAVTKTVDLPWINGLIELGQMELAENRPQQLSQRATAITQPVTWHFIGHLQRNKVELVLPIATWIHSVDSLRLLKCITEHATKTGRTPHLLLEVNISGEHSKGGFSREELREAWPEIQQITQVSLAGLMTMAPLSDDPEMARPVFRGLREFRDELAQHHPDRFPLPELSMGMSGDFEVAIEEGATMVRVGSLLFEPS